jgi:hypothetical protein
LAVTFDRVKVTSTEEPPPTHQLLNRPVHRVERVSANAHESLELEDCQYAQTAALAPGAAWQSRISQF